MPPMGLNSKSQSPALPNELRSLGRVEYSNYDDFIRARNEFTLPRRNLRAGDGNATRPPSSFKLSGDHSDSDCSWQMNSLPVDFGRNLTTLFGERQPVARANLAKVRRQSRRLTQIIAPSELDDSFSSARSDMFNQSQRSSSATPTKFTYFPSSVAPPPPTEPDRCSSKLSLTSSTYKVFQSPLAKFKRLFRDIQRPFSRSGAPSRADEGGENKTGKTSAGQQTCARSLADFSLSDSMSSTSLNKSQSPTVLPPALPDELKSLGYIGDSVEYSNYDDFIKARNELTLPRRNLRAGEGNGARQQSSFKSGGGGGDDSDDCSLQMTSLPVYFESNLTTLFEEKQPVARCTDLVNVRQRRQHRRPTQTSTAPIDLERELRALETDEIYQSIKPPERFDDSANGAAQEAASLEFRRRQPASPFRFSFGQPLSDPDQVSVNSNLGLPPRLPTAQRDTSSNQRHL